MIIILGALLIFFAIVGGILGLGVAGYVIHDAYDEHIRNQGNDPPDTDPKRQRDPEKLF